MAFCIHALNISYVITLLHLIHGTVGCAGTDQAATHQTGTRPDSGTLSATECCTRSSAYRCTDYDTGDATIYARLIGSSAANLITGKLSANSIVVTKSFKRNTSARQHHDSWAVGQTGTTCYC
jgi:hypothetical protein